MTTTVQRIALGTEIHTLKWLGETRAGQELLAASRRANQRPRCMCVPDGVEMYVGRRGRIHYLSRMPGTGFLHADTCQSVESASLFSGIHAYASGAIVEQADGLVSLSLDIERLDRQEPPLTRVSIDGLLETLVEQADLNRIGPASTARTWASVRDRLGEAAGWIQVGGKPLSPLLYLPERYDKANGAASQSTCEDFIVAAQGQALLCAPLKEICWTTYSWKISLKHLPGLRLWVSKDVASELERRWRTPCFTRPPRYALCLVVAKPGRRPGNYTVTNMTCLATDSTYLPCRNDREALIASELLAAGHSLLRPLRFDCAPSQVLADFAILDGNDPEPVFVLSPTGDEELDLAKRRLASVMQRHQAPMRVFDA